MQHVLIINPHAGKRNQTARFYATADTLRTQHGLECQCMLTSCSGGAASMARTLPPAGNRSGSMPAAGMGRPAKWPTASPGIPTPP